MVRTKAMTGMSHSKRMLRAVSAIAAVYLASILCAGKAKESSTGSGKPIAVKGTWVECNTTTDSRADGDNQLLTVATSEKFTGTLNGTCEATERSVVHKDGTGSFSGSGTFSGEINGKAGTAIVTQSGTIDGKGLITAHWVIDQGTDDLARIDGQGTFEGKRIQPGTAECSDSNSQSQRSGTYVGTVRFAP